MSESANNERKIQVYLEPTKSKVRIAVTEGAEVGEVVQGMVTHLQQASGFDLDRYLSTTVGDGFGAEWQLFRERENMQLLPAGARFGELQPPIEEEESFTVKVNAKVA